MEPWRERIASSGYQPPPDQVAQFDRQDMVVIAAIKVFGSESKAYQWVHRPSHSFGNWATPYEVAGESDDRLQLVLAHLTELAMTVVPEPPDPILRGRKRTWKPRFR